MPENLMAPWTRARALLRQRRVRAWLDGRGSASLADLRDEGYDVVEVATMRAEGYAFVKPDTCPPWMVVAEPYPPPHACSERPNPCPYVRFKMRAAPDVHKEWTDG